MSEQPQFGPWTVVDTLTGSGRTCYLVRKAESQPLHVLKTANKNGRISSITKAQNETHQANKIRNEIKVLKRLTDHPNIITLVDYDSEAQTPWHVTEYCSGNLFNYDNWSAEELKLNNFRDKLNDLAKAVGYANSKGISLGSDIEIFVTGDKRFIIGDLETANIWQNHHIDTTEDIKAFTRIRDGIKEKAERIRRQKTKERDKQRQVQRALEQAQPSAPRRLAAE